MSLGREAIPSKASCDCTTHIDCEVYPTWRSLSDLMMSEPAGRGAIPGKASWTALPTLVSDSDSGDGNKVVSEIRINCDDYFKLNDTNISGNFESGYST